MPNRFPYILPSQLDHSSAFDDLLRLAIREGASDVLFTPFRKVFFRKYGKLIAATNRPIDNREVDNCIRFACSSDSSLTNIIGGDAQNTRYDLPSVDGERNSYNTPKIRGFRVNVSPCFIPSSPWAAQIVMRVIPDTVPTVSDLLIASELVEAATPRDGIVYMAGKTGSGKSTTIAAIIRYILENETPIQGNIITAEEPIEYLFDEIQSKHSVVAQSQIPNHFPSFEAANREAMRRVPALAFIGELRDEESVNAGVNMALSGHTAMGTIHASSVASTIPRLLSYYANDVKSSAFFNIADTTRLFIAQKLVPRVDVGVVAVREYLIVSEKVQELLFNLTDLSTLNRSLGQIMQDHGHSFEKDAMRLYDEGLISKKTLMEFTFGDIDDK